MRELVLLVGLPGSGKSTLSKIEFKDHVRISQDDFYGNRKKMEDYFFAVLNQTNKSIIVDRTNISKKQRQWFIDKARKSGTVELIRCVVCICDKDVCIERIMKRTDHGTIKDVSIDKAREIVYNFINTYEGPKNDEGINQILYIRTGDDTQRSS
jgi:predicted kinase